jgi:IS5 family transposase
VTNKTKPRYRIRNWKEYNRALVGRGSITLWIDERAIQSWLNHDYLAQRGRPRTYADAAIVCSLMLREVYHLPLRATAGLVSSVLSLLQTGLPAPDYSTLSRRARLLNVPLLSGASGEPLHLIVDSTGLKLYGEGEWKVRLHGWAKHRTWRKLHIGIDAQTQQVRAAVLTNKEVVDPRVLPRLLKQIEVAIQSVTADGAYDSRECYRAIDKRGAEAIIPPRKGSNYWRDEYLKDRNSNLKVVRRLGVKGWKKKAGYHQRSLVETAMFRLKTLFTDKLRSREVKRQATEVMIRCGAMNRMTELGMPQSYVI